MEIKEEISKIEKFMTEDPLCKEKEEPENRGWQCRIGKKGSPGDLGVPTAKRLYDNMTKAGFSLPSMPSQKNPKPKKPNWDLEECNPNCYPFQSHHLIPKMHLPGHKVCVWLAKNAANSHWKLTESTNYDTDDARNGMPLPFASTTYQWGQTMTPLDLTEQEKICNRMMFLTKKQLHQGSHTYEDYGEQDNLHADEQPGYRGVVDELLKVVNGQTMNHVWFCNDCNKSYSKPIKVRPLERVVLSVHQVSSIMGSIITGHKRFVSNKAAQYWRKILGR